MTSEPFSQLREVVRAFERDHGFGVHHIVDLVGVVDVLLPGR
jgi:hypothetical protein